MEPTTHSRLAPRGRHSTEQPQRFGWNARLLLIAFFSLFLASSSPRMLYFGEGA
jgi:hypothetical protein